MDEKRYIFETVEITDDNGESRVVDVITDKEECYSYENLCDIAVLLNGKEATIQRLEKENQRVYGIIEDGGVLLTEKQLLDVIGEDKCDMFFREQETSNKLQEIKADAKIQVIKDNNRLKNKIKQLETQISHLKWENEELRERGLEMKYEDDLKTINQDIKEIYLILIELESLETGENADYTDISTDIGYCKMLLKDRLMSLKRKAETEGAII